MLTELNVHLSILLEESVISGDVVDYIVSVDWYCTFEFFFVSLMVVIPFSVVWLAIRLFFSARYYRAVMEIVHKWINSKT